MSGVRDILATARETLLLEQAEVRSRAMGDEQRLVVARLTTTAIARMDAAASTGVPGSTGVACGLYRDAIVLLLSAHAVARDASERGAAGATLALQELPSHDEVREHDAIARAIRSEDPLEFDRPDAPPDDATLDRLEETATRLLAGLEPRTPWAIRRARRVRLAVAIGVAIALLFLAFRGGRASENLALRKPVSASTVDPSSPPLSGLVDGELHGAFGARTQPERSPWLLVDLEGSYSIDRIVVVNRGDGSFDQGLPLVIEVSVDAQAFTSVGRRIEPFTQDEPWRVDTHGARGRYVRFRVDKPSYLALTEVEIYGRK